MKYDEPEPSAANIVDVQPDLDNITNLAGEHLQENLEEESCDNIGCQLDVESDTSKGEKSMKMWPQ